MIRFLAPALIGLLGAAILVALGVWQMQRLDWKQGVLANIETRIAGDPEPLPETLDPDAQRYQPVELRGEILRGEIQVLVSMKPVGAGYRIIAPFVTDDGRRILLDRGFVADEARGNPRDTGPVRVIGNLHWPDDRNSSTPENDTATNTWFARDIGPMAEALDTEPLLVVAREVTPADPGVTPLPVSTAGIPNDHLQYAITWFSLAVIWLAMTTYWIFRRAKDRTS